MPTYKRWYQPGGTYFFTVNLFNRKSDLLVREVAALRAAFKKVRERFPFEIDAIVIMPEHLHCVWTLPMGDDNYALRWSRIKVEFTRAVRVRDYQSLSRRNNREREIWQRRFWEHVIRDEDDLNSHIDYIHYNPVKHGLVNSPRNWKYSSFHRYVKQGILDEDWSASRDVEKLDLG